MNRNKTFIKFVMGFVAIVALGFGVLIFAGSELEPHPVDNVAGAK